MLLEGASRREERDVIDLIARKLSPKWPELHLPAEHPGTIFFVSETSFSYRADKIAVMQVVITQISSWIHSIRSIFLSSMI